MSVDLYDPSAPTTISDVNLTSAASPSKKGSTFVVASDLASSTPLSEKHLAESSTSACDHANTSVASDHHVAEASRDVVLGHCGTGKNAKRCADDDDAGSEEVSSSKSDGGFDVIPTLSQGLSLHSTSVVAIETSAPVALPDSCGSAQATALSSGSHRSPLRQLNADERFEDKPGIRQQANPTSSVVPTLGNLETLTAELRPKRSPSVGGKDLVLSGRSRRKSGSSPVRSSSRDRHSVSHRPRCSPSSESKTRSTDRDSLRHARSPERDPGAKRVDRRDRRRGESRDRSPAGRDDRRRSSQVDRHYPESEYRKHGHFEDQRPYRRDDRSHNAQGYRRSAYDSGRHAEGQVRRHTGSDRKRTDREERTEAERSTRSGRREWRSPYSHSKRRSPSDGDIGRQSNTQQRQQRDGATGKRDSHPLQSRSGSPAHRQSRSPIRRPSRSPSRRQSRSPPRRQSRDHDAQHGLSEIKRSACSNGDLQRKSSPPAIAKAETVTSNHQNRAGRCEPGRNSPSSKPVVEQVSMGPRRSEELLKIADPARSSGSSSEASRCVNSTERLWPHGRTAGAEDRGKGTRDGRWVVQPPSEKAGAELQIMMATPAESGSTREPASNASAGAPVLSSSAQAIAATDRVQPSISPGHRDIPASHTFEASKNLPPVDVARSFSFSELMRLPPPPLPPPSLIMPLASCAPMPLGIGPVLPSVPFAPGIHGSILPPHSAGPAPPLTSLGVTLAPLGVPPPPLGVPPPPPLGLLPPAMPNMQIPMPFVSRPAFAPHLSSHSAPPPFALPQHSVGGRQPFQHVLAGLPPSASQAPPPSVAQAPQPSPAAVLSFGVRGIDRLVGVHSSIVSESHRQQHPDHASTVPASPPPPPELFLDKQNGDDAVKSRSNLIVIRTEDAGESAGGKAQNSQRSRNDRYSSSDDMTEAPMDMAADDDVEDDDDDTAFVAPPSKALTNGKEESDETLPQKTENQQAEPTGDAGSGCAVDANDHSHSDVALNSHHVAEPPQAQHRTIEVLQQLQQLLSRGGSSQPGQDEQAKADMHSGVLGAVLAGKASSKDEPAAEAVQRRTRKAAAAAALSLKVKETSPGSDIPSSATELSNQRVIEKMNRQERIAEEIKVVLKPYYRAGKISKVEYKEIMKKAVHKIYNSKSGAINPSKVKAFVDGYVTKTIQMQKLLKKRQHVQT